MELITTPTPTNIHTKISINYNKESSLTIYQEEELLKWHFP